MLSTSTRGCDEWAWAIREMKGISIKRKVGFVGDSIHINCGRI